MKYEEYNPKCSNCIIRTFMKLFDKDELLLQEELIELANKMNESDYNNINAFEKYLENNNYEKIDMKDILVKDLDLNGKYACFCYKDNWYHMIAIIDNIVYDKTPECLDMNVISLYRR